MPTRQHSRPHINHDIYRNASKGFPILWSKTTNRIRVICDTGCGILRNGHLINPSHAPLYVICYQVRRALHCWSTSSSRILDDSIGRELALVVQLYPRQHPFFKFKYEVDVDMLV